MIKEQTLYFVFQLVDRKFIVSNKAYQSPRPNKNQLTMAKNNLSEQKKERIRE